MRWPYHTQCLLPNRIIFSVLGILLVSIIFLQKVTGQIVPDSILNQIPEPRTPENQVDFLNDQAWNNKSSQPQLAFKYADIAFQLAKEANYQKGLGDAFHTKGMIKWYISEYEDASMFFFEALKIREELNDSIGLARSFNNIGNVFYRQENDSLALVYYQKALDLREMLKDSVGLIYSYNNIGDVLSKKDDEQATLKTYAKSYYIAEKIGELKGLAFVCTNLGKYYLQRERYEEALEFFNEALDITEKLNDKYAIAVNLNKVAEVYFLMNKPREAIPLLERSIALSTRTEGKSILSMATENISKAYASQGDYQKAYEYQLAHQEVATSILNKSKDLVILEIQAKYDHEKKQRLKDVELRKKEKEVNALTTFILIFSLITIGILFFLSLSRYHFQTRMNRLLQEKNRRIEMQNKTLMQTNTSLEQFAYIASHDLKEPLRTIGSYCTLIKRKYMGKLDEEADEYLNFIVKGVKQMYSLLEDVLAYARTDNEASMKKEFVKMEKVVESVKESLNKIIQQKKVEIKVGALPEVWANPFQMHQVLQNLISNGIKFNESKPLKILISAKAEEDEYVFSVKDNGIGIKPQYQHQIFKLFHRLDNQKYSGTGLGLAICAKIIANHDGKIWVESHEGKGSTFYFSIPRKKIKQQTEDELSDVSVYLNK